MVQAKCLLMQLWQHLVTDCLSRKKKFVESSRTLKIFTKNEMVVKYSAQQQRVLVKDVLKKGRGTISQETDDGILPDIG